MEECGLAAAGASDDGCECARPEAAADVVECSLAVGGGAEVLADLLQLAGDRRFGFVVQPASWHIFMCDLLTVEAFERHLSAVLGDAEAARPSCLSERGL